MFHLGVDIKVKVVILIALNDFAVGLETGAVNIRHDERVWSCLELVRSIWQYLEEGEDFWCDFLSGDVSLVELARVQMPNVANFLIVPWRLFITRLGLKCKWRSRLIWSERWK